MRGDGLVRLRESRVRATGIGVRLLLGVLGVAVVVLPRELDVDEVDVVGVIGVLLPRPPEAVTKQRGPSGEWQMRGRLVCYSVFEPPDRRTS